MPLPPSSISQVCKTVRDFVRSGLNVNGNSVDVSLGIPANAEPARNDDHQVNLFFHRFGPAGFGEHGAPDEPLWLRLYCLITAFGVTEDGISAGENDLRLIGEVIRLFRETPVLDPIDVENQSIQLQVIFQPLSLDEINHLWSTQGDVAYRPSLHYEMALSPVMPKKLAIGGPRVATLGAEVRSTLTNRSERYGGIFSTPPVTTIRVDVDRVDWIPAICFVHDGMCAQSLVFKIGDADLGAFEARIWVAGSKTETVTFQWETWTQDKGWSTIAVADTETTPISEVIDPENPPSVGDLKQVDLPFDDEAGQAMLYAIHTYQLDEESSLRETRSNPLLVTLFKE